MNEYLLYIIEFDNKCVYIIHIKKNIFNTNFQEQILIFKYSFPFLILLYTNVSLIKLLFNNMNQSSMMNEFKFNEAYSSLKESCLKLYKELFTMKEKNEHLIQKLKVLESFISSIG